MPDTPLYTHDCERCIFLWCFTDPEDGRHYDLYYADHGGMPDTLIARYGSDGPEYTSGLGFVGKIPAITEANRIAQERGLIIRTGGNA